jgi:hypothetical protein
MTERPIEVKADRVLHVVQESFENPRHRFLGSVKDSAGRREYFACRGFEVDSIVAEGRSDEKVIARLETMDLRPYRVAVFELPLYPRSLKFLRHRAPHVRRWTRPINAELLQQIDLFRAHWRHPYARDQRDQLFHDVRTAGERFQLDWACARHSDAVLSISDWETEHYWRWIAGRQRAVTVPYFQPAGLTVEPPQDVAKRPLCVCPLSTAKSVRPFPLDAFRRFAELVRGCGMKAPEWSFAMTGSTRVKTNWSGAISTSLLVPERIQELGFVEDPMALLAGARAVAVLSELGFGVKTKILDAVAARCWVLVPRSLYERLPAELRPYCLVVDPLDSVDGFRAALQKALQPFPDGDPNALLRARAFAALDRLMEAK